ncbi:MAG: serine/threonine-protein kinase, partial [Candidatus Margulisbacteria bacterium]|nr:serine/threonine-protein kinase [Candidatus Margulisiibacteriota bacterium]
MMSNNYDYLLGPIKKSFNRLQNKLNGTKGSGRQGAAAADPSSVQMNSGAKPKASPVPKTTASTESPQIDWYEHGYAEGDEAHNYSLGKGGMAEVSNVIKSSKPGDYVVREPQHTISSRAFKHEMGIARFLIGKKIINVPGIMEVHNNGTIVMEKAPGVQLSDLINDNPSAIKKGAVKIAKETGKALADMAKKGIAHSDVKPGNIMVELGADGEIKSVRLIDLFTSVPTRKGGVPDGGVRAATPNYAAPEQMPGTATEKSDVFSLGKVLYKMLTGKNLFEEDSRGIVKATVGEKISAEHPALADAPEGTRPLLGRMLAKAPSARPSARDVVTDLETLESEGRVTNYDAANKSYEVSNRASAADGESLAETKSAPTESYNGSNVKPESDVTVALPKTKGAVVGPGTPRANLNSVRTPLNYRQFGVGLGSTVLGLGVGFGTHYL